LIKLNIPEKQIAIQTATIKELNNVDLLSKDCEIRYIITINALKE
jgi:type III restriction enzyme